MMLEIVWSHPNAGFGSWRGHPFKYGRLAPHPQLMWEDDYDNIEMIDQKPLTWTS